MKTQTDLVRQIKTLVAEWQDTSHDTRCPLSFENPAHIASLLQATMQDLEQEELRVVMLDPAGSVIDIETVNKGTATSVGGTARDLFRTAVRRNATGILIAHNHPAGQCRPSDRDRICAKNYIPIGAVLEVHVLDSLVVARDGVYSIRGNRVIHPTDTTWGDLWPTPEVAVEEPETFQDLLDQLKAVLEAA